MKIKHVRVKNMCTEQILFSEGTTWLDEQEPHPSPCRSSGKAAFHGKREKFYEADRHQDAGQLG